MSLPILARHDAAEPQQPGLASEVFEQLRLPRWPASRGLQEALVRTRLGRRCWPWPKFSASFWFPKPWPRAKLWPGFAWDCPKQRPHHLGSSHSKTTLAREIVSLIRPHGPALRRLHRPVLPCKRRLREVRGGRCWVPKTVFKQR